MPNHFHFVIHADQRTVQTKLVGSNERNVLSEAIRNLLQTYSKAINVQNNTVGSLFQQNTKAKCLTDSSVNYAPVCFDYVHQNAWKARLVKKMEDWEFSSFADYAGLRKGTLCNQDLAFQLLDINTLTFYEDSYKAIDPSLLDFIF